MVNTSMDSVVSNYVPWSRSETIYILPYTSGINGIIISGLLFNHDDSTHTANVGLYSKVTPQSDVILRSDIFDP